MARFKWKKRGVISALLALVLGGFGASQFQPVAEVLVDSVIEYPDEKAAREAAEQGSNDGTATDGAGQRGGRGDHSHSAPPDRARSTDTKAGAGGASHLAEAEEEADDGGGLDWEKLEPDIVAAVDRAYRAIEKGGG